jgi:hypothetical protein
MNSRPASRLPLQLSASHEEWHKQEAILIQSHDMSLTNLLGFSDRDFRILLYPISDYLSYTVDYMRNYPFIMVLQFFTRHIVAPPIRNPPYSAAASCPRQASAVSFCAGYKILAPFPRFSRLADVTPYVSNAI